MSITRRLEWWELMLLGLCALMAVLVMFAVMIHNVERDRHLWDLRPDREAVGYTRPSSGREFPILSEED